ncbi:MAG: hypothetical protein V4539_00895 [Bacteroidota bacterium]
MSEETDLHERDAKMHTENEPPHFPEDPHVITPSPEITPMEVHHHPHVEKKNFKEYILEGLMIFLAVSMGFFAESYREHLVNKEREKQYVNSFYQDLKNDQNELPTLIRAIRRQQLEPAASLPVLFSKVSLTTPADSIYYFFRKFIRQQGVKAFITDRTFEQIKNAGEMRLITNRQVADSLIDYYKQIGFIDYLQQTLLGYKSRFSENLPLVLKSTDYAIAIDSSNGVIMPAHHVYLLSKDPFIVNKILIQVDDIGALSNTIKIMVEEALRKNDDIRKLIEDKYGIEN